MNAKLITTFLVLALASMACGFNFEVDLPEKVTPGPEVTEDISIPYPAGGDANLRLSFGAGEMKLSPGAARLVEGTATYNYADFKPVIVANDANVRIKMNEVLFKGFPTFEDLKNEWDFKLGTDPMDLVIEAGAYKGTYELGGLSLNSLDIQDGAAQVKLSFSEQNQVEMSTFRYSTGASDIEMTGLANANFSIFDFSGGAGGYTLDFSGDLQRDASIKIETGFSNMILVIPEGVNAIVTVESGVSNVNAGSGWSQNGQVYKQAGEGPALTFVVEMGAGNLTLTK